MSLNLEPALYWMTERQSIKTKKDRGDPPPWTLDPIIANFRFTNVRREDDRVTVWIRENIREPYADHPNLWFMLCIGRWINWPNTLAELIAEGAWPDHAGFRPEHMTEVITARAQRGEKCFTSAYIIRGAFGMPKAKSVSEITLGGAWRDRVVMAPKMRRTLQEAHEALAEGDYWGPFMSYQSVIDMRYCPHLLAQAPDVETWAAAGPGTLRGLNRLHGRRYDQPLHQTQALTELLELFALLKRSTDVNLDLSDVLNCCCEVDKYLRLKNGEGSVRAKYHARNPL